MIEVSFVSLSQNEAHNKSATFLDRFAIRKGEKIWFTRTTYTNLNNFLTKLEELLSKEKELSIAIYIHNKKETRLYKIIGQNLFDKYYNAVPVFYTKKQHYHLKEKNNLIPLIEVSLLFSSILHDIGKNNTSFQTKIRKKHSNTRDIIRHDLASLIILENKNLFNKFLKNELKGENLNKEIYFDNVLDFIERIFKDDVFSLFDVIKFTILTHHKTFKTEYYDFSEIIDEYSNKSSEKCLIFNDFDFSYIERINELFDEYKQDLAIKISKEDFSNIYLFTRTLLMFADHYASTKEFTKKITDNMILANKTQRLESHLIEVFNESKRVFDELLLKNKIKHTTINLEKSKDKKFIWQDRASEFIKNNKSNNDVFFIINNAQTGAGKTIGNVKILKAINEKLRFNFLFPMRNLSTQTYNVFAKELNIKKKDLVLVIGENKTKEDKIEQDETDYINDIIYSPFLEKQFDRNENYKFLYHSPVVVGTFDYLMRATENKKSKYLIPLMRLFTSDIIIDEIDNFNIKDLQAIERFFFLAGMFGVNTIISSATLTYPLIDKILQAYKKGFEFYKQIYNNKKLKVIGINNVIEPTILSDNEKIKEFLDKTNELLKESKVKLEIIKEFNPKTILKQVYKYHNQFKQKINDKFVSMGFVKFFYVKELFENYLAFLQYLKENKRENYKILTLFTHSQEFESIKAKKDKLLYEILQKKDRTYLKNFYELVKDYKEKNIIFLLFTTPVLEVGKDFDFDYGFSEFTALADAVQIAGRIQRHRNKEGKLALFFKERNNFKYVNSLKKEEIIDELNLLKNVNTILLFNNKIALSEQKFINKKLEASLNYTDENNCILSANHNDKYKFRESISKTITFMFKKDKFYPINANNGFFMNKLDNEIDFKFNEFLLKKFSVKEDMVNVSFYKNDTIDDFMYDFNFGVLRKI